MLLRQDHTSLLTFHPNSQAETEGNVNELRLARREDGRLIGFTVVYRVVLPFVAQDCCWWSVNSIVMLPIGD